MLECFRGREQSFPPLGVVADYGEESEEVGLLLRGQAELIRIDAEGNRTLLEHLEEGDVFGRQLLGGSGGEDSVCVVAEEPCRVLFLNFLRLVGRCPNACAKHTRLEQNMIRLVTGKVQSLGERVEVLSRRTIREKLLCYFSLQRGKYGNGFQLPFSLSKLADYISADRSAMMRELKKLREEGRIAMDHRRITLCSPAKL